MPVLPLDPCRMSVPKLATIRYRKIDPPLKIVLRLAPLPSPVPNKGPLLNRAFKKEQLLNPNKDRRLNRELKKDRRPSLEPSSGPRLKLVRKPGPLLSQRRKKRKSPSRRGKNRLANLRLDRNQGKVQLHTPTLLCY